jgi:6-phosphogluconolactonase
MASETALALDVLADAEAVAECAAALLAAELTAAVAARGRATLAVSGGRTPLATFALLAAAPVPWYAIDVLQVDERFAPHDSDERNAVQLARSFGGVATSQRTTFHWMPVDDGDRYAGAKRYAETLSALAGEPPIIDVVQLGLGADGHTASLFPNVALETVTSTVALSPAAGAWQRMTLTLATLNAARSIVWLVTGRDKRAALASLLAGDPAIVGSGVRRSRTRIVADRAAAGP